MSEIPRQAGPGDKGDMQANHRLNRIFSLRRGGDPHSNATPGKGNTMEITFSQNVNYSMDLSKAEVRRELADYLDITVKEMMKMVEKETLYELHEDKMIAWLESKEKSWEALSHDDIEVDQVLA